MIKQRFRKMVGYFDSFLLAHHLQFEVTAQILKRFHVLAFLVWVCCIWPTLTTWAESVRWLNFMSIYAILVGHATGWASARVERRQEKKDEQEETP